MSKDKVKLKGGVPILTMKKKFMATDAFHKIWRKLNSAEISDYATLMRVRGIIRALTPVTEKIREEYLKKIQDVYVEKFKEADLNGFDINKEPEEPDAEVDQEMKDQYTKDKKEFDKKRDTMKSINDWREDADQKFYEETVTVRCMPLAPEHLDQFAKQVKLSGAEIEALGPLFDETGEVRGTVFQNKADKGQLK